MSEQEALNIIKELRNKIIHTKSQKLKRLYMIDLINLKELLAACYDKEIDESEIYVSGVYERTWNAIEKSETNEPKQYIQLNDYTKALSNSCLKNFASFDFQQEIPTRIQLSTKLLDELTMDFLSMMDNDTKEKYQDLASKVLISDIFEYGGICWNFYGINRQVINLSSLYYQYNKNFSDIDFYKVFFHELGHAVHLHKINHMSKNENFIGAFDESISMLYEKMFLHFLESNNIDIRESLKTDCGMLLECSIVARAGALAVENNDLNNDATIPNKYFSKAYFDHYSDISRFFYNEYYVDLLPYFYGGLISTKIMDEFGSDYKNASKETINILIESESKKKEIILDDIGLDKVPKGMVKTLVKIKK